jgi:superfamily II DNA/RNA helicase
MKESETSGRTWTSWSGRTKGSASQDDAKGFRTKRIVNRTRYIANYGITKEIKGIENSVKAIEECEQKAHIVICCPGRLRGSCPSLNQHQHHYHGFPTTYTSQVYSKNTTFSLPMTYFPIFI